MSQRIHITLFFLLTSFIFAQNEAVIQQSEEKSIDFNLRVDPQTPNIGVFSANTSDLDRLTLLEPRSLPFSTAGNSAEINCVSGNTTKSVTYGQAEQCDRIEWEVTFDNIDGLDVNVSEQKNLYSETGWWVLFEWGMLPRIKEDLNINVCIYGLDRISKKDCSKLPGENQAPLIMFWGKSNIEFKAAGRKFRIYTDSLGSGMINERTQQRLKKQYSYLTGLFPPGDIHDRVVDIAWVGIEEKWNTIGGAAGENAYISNYVISENNFEMSLERLFWVSGHEIFHMISSYSYSLWISESLAHYYGYKSLAQHGPVLTTPNQEWDKKKKSVPKGKAGLYEAHTKVLNNESGYYGLFYDKGAAFWHDLDTRLENNGESLDHYLSLLSSPQQGNGELGSEFATEIINTIGRREFEQLVSEYLQ